MSSGTGIEQAKPINSLLEKWEISEIVGIVKSMVFDTTESNTGLRNGKCALLEKKLNRELLWFACRHHVLWTKH